MKSRDKILFIQPVGADFFKHSASMAGVKEEKVIWYVIRHADKETGNFYNPVLRHQDQPISVNGRAAAKKLAVYFTDKPIAAIYVSEYLRTRQTSEYVAQQLKISPIVDGRLNEVDNGVIEGLSSEEIKQKFPAVWNAFRKRDQDFRFPQGENGKEVQQRIKLFFEEKQLKREDIILVSHDGWIRVLLCYLLGIPVYRRWDFTVDTCGIMEIEYQLEFKRWKLLRLNQICA